MVSFATQLDRRSTKVTAAFGPAALPKSPGPAPAFTPDHAPSAEMIRQVAVGQSQAHQRAAALNAHASAAPARPNPHSPNGLATLMKMLNPVDPVGLAASAALHLSGVGPVAAAIGGMAATLLTPQKHTTSHHRQSLPSAAPFAVTSMTPGYTTRTHAPAAEPPSFAETVMPLLMQKPKPAALQSARGQARDYDRVAGAILGMNDTHHANIRIDHVSDGQWSQLNARSHHKLARGEALTLAEMGVDTDAFGKLKPTMHSIGTAQPKLAAPAPTFH